MTGPELKALAERMNENPYYLAYALATGARSSREAYDRDGNNHKYMAWNNDRWHEQAKAEGVPREAVSRDPSAVDRHIAICAAHILAHVMVPDCGGGPEEDSRTA